VTFASAAYVVEEAPTATKIVYAVPSEAPFKIQTTGSAGTGLYLSSSLNRPNTGAGPDAYTFGGPGNVFVYLPDVGFGPFGLDDSTLRVDTVYDRSSGRVFPLRFTGSFGTNMFCIIQAAADGGQQQTCPFECREFDVAPPGNWNCGGQWYTRNTGSCSAFQAYVVSQ
jgi:hypothetical protein